MASKKDAFTAPEAVETDETVETPEVETGIETEVVFGDNKVTKEDAEKIATKLGKDAANGMNALPTLGVNMASWAEQLLVNPDAPEQADIKAGRAKETDDDVRHYFSLYASEEGKGMNARTAGSIKSQLSKLRAFAKLGARTDINPTDVLQRANAMRKELKAKGTAVKPAYDALVQVCRDIDGKPDLNDKEMTTAIVAKAPRVDSAESVWNAIDTQVKKLFELKLDTGDVAKNVRSLVQTRKSQLTQAMKYTRLADEARKLGLAVVRDENIEEIME